MAPPVDLSSLSEAQMKALRSNTSKALKDKKKERARAQAHQDHQDAARDEERYRRRKAEERLEEDAVEAASDNVDADGYPKVRRGEKKSYWDQSDDEERPSGRGGMHVADTSEAESENDEADRPSKARRGNNRERIPRIEHSSPREIARSLPPRRKRKGTIVAASKSGPVPARSSTTRQSSPPNTPPRSSSPVDQAPFTPYDAARAEGALMTRQTPTSKALSKKGSVHFRIKVSLESGFPDEVEIVQMAKACFLEACAELKATNRAARFMNEQLYSDTMVDIVKRGASQLRGELKTKAQNLVATNFALLGLSVVETKVRIAQLVDRGSFHFEDPQRRHRVFRNPIILTLATQQWFARRNGEAVGIYAAQFNPIPEEMIALIVTAIECALNDYTEGTFKPKSNDFSTETYGLVYGRHLHSIQKYKLKKPAAFRDLQKSIWEGAWLSAGRAIPRSGPHSDLDDDDFSDSEVTATANNLVAVEEALGAQST
ncbi:hypothetical protein DENSPDRAFT_887077 [Dentipellis sp. KUC8613]|nr:hypothetical protein DENSPDRAFT_887077 [Dentipellis sp. KUC8613]